MTDAFRQFESVARGYDPGLCVYGPTAVEVTVTALAAHPGGTLFGESLNLRANLWDEALTADRVGEVLRHETDLNVLLHADRNLADARAWAAVGDWLGPDSNRVMDDDMGGLVRGVVLVCPDFTDPALALRLLGADLPAVAAPACDAGMFRPAGPTGLPEPAGVYMTPAAARTVFAAAARAYGVARLSLGEHLRGLFRPLYHSGARR